MADSNRGEQKVAIYVDEEDEVWLWFDYFVLGCIESVVWFWFVFGWLSMAWSSWTSGIWDDSIHNHMYWRSFVMNQYSQRRSMIASLTQCSMLPSG